MYSAANTSWTESTLTWNSRPAAGTTALATQTVATSTAKWYEWDVTSFLQAEKAAGRNIVTLVLRSLTTTTPHMIFASDEAGRTSRSCRSRHDGRFADDGCDTILRQRHRRPRDSSAASSGSRSRGIGDHGSGIHVGNALSGSLDHHRCFSGSSLALSRSCSSRSVGGTLLHDDVVAALTLDVSDDLLAPTPSWPLPPTGYKCPNCGASARRRGPTSLPSGDAKCAFCKSWFNIHRPETGRAPKVVEYPREYPRRARFS